MSQEAVSTLPFPESFGPNLRTISRIQAAKPKQPKTIISQGLVCSHLSRKYPRSPPTATAPTKVKGTSMAMASWLELLCTFCRLGFRDSGLSGLLSEGILGEPRERLRIQPGGEGDKHGDAEGHGLRAGHDRTRSFAGLLEPGVYDDAEVVVQRGNDIQHGEDGEHRMVRFNQRKKNEILAHEAGRRRNARKGKHENEQQNSGSGAAVVEAVQIVEFLADEPFLANHDDHRERACGHEDVGKQVVGNSR